MQLLVSVATEADAAQAIAGGADWIDAKDPSQGPLGRVTAAQLGRIAGVVGRSRPMSAALGEIDTEAEARRLMSEYSRCGGAVLLKIGLGRVAAADDITLLTAAAIDALGPDSSRVGVVAVAYGDEGPW